jgi:hypothetical protein
LKHFATSPFWLSYGQLPPAMQKLADKNFELLRTDPRHKSLHLKKVGAFWSARIGINYRAVAKERADGLIWIWIGTHDQYKRLISS